MTSSKEERKKVAIRRTLTGITEIEATEKTRKEMGKGESDDKTMSK